jgi:hypothetical protein
LSQAQSAFQQVVAVIFNRLLENQGAKQEFGYRRLPPLPKMKLPDAFVVTEFEPENHL